MRQSSKKAPRTPACPRPHPPPTPAEVEDEIADFDVRILTKEGEVLRHLTLDPTKIYQSLGKSNVSTMS